MGQLYITTWLSYFPKITVREGYRRVEFNKLTLPSITQETCGFHIFCNWSHFSHLSLYYWVAYGDEEYRWLILTCLLREHVCCTIFWLIVQQQVILILKFLITSAINARCYSLLGWHNSLLGWNFMSTKRIEIIPEIESWNKQLICGSCSILILKLPEMSSNIVIKDRPSHLILIFCGKISFLLVSKKEN